MSILGLSLQSGDWMALPLIKGRSASHVDRGNGSVTFPAQDARTRAGASRRKAFFLEKRSN
jgi:hypothetical protein